MMPVYTFFNKENGMEYDDIMTMEEYDKFIEANPHIVRVWHTAPAMVGDHVMGVGPKTDEGFKENMQRIASAHPDSPLANRYGSGKTIAQQKAKRVVDKHIKRQK